MAEGMAFDLVTGVLGKLGSHLWDEIGLLRSFKDDAKDLERQLEKIQAVLLDAEERSSVEIEETRALRIWLRELKGAAYDIDDLLDEIQTQVLLRKQQREVQNQNQLAKKVLHLMNKINIPAPFRMALPTAPLLPQVPAPPPPPPPLSSTKPQLTDLSSDESKMESSYEDRDDTNRRKHVKREAICRASCS